MAKSPWIWCSDEMPEDGQEVWIRGIVLCGKPIRATWQEGGQFFTYVVDGRTYAFPFFIVLQWRLLTV
jgi:hypothetical protein